MYGGKQLPSSGMGGKQLPASIGGKQLPAPAVGGKQLPAAIGGKQLPPSCVAIGGKQLPPTTPSEDLFASATPPPVEALTVVPASKYWRMRKAADDLVESRSEVTTTTNANLDMPLFTDWSGILENCLDLVDHQAVRSSLDIAAQCVLDALQKPEIPEATTAESEDIPNLPVELEQTQMLLNLRHECMERARNNREYAKRPKKKTAPTPPASAVKKTTKATVTVAVNTASSNSNNSPRDAVASTAEESPKKFTRNTPAASAAAMDARLSASRATLCATASLVFGKLTPGDVPPEAVGGEASSTKCNMNEAHTLSDRIIHVVNNATKRSDLRFAFRHRVAESSTMRLEEALTDSETDDGDDDDDMMEIDSHGDATDHSSALTSAWKESCVPRLQSILKQGAGHALVLDEDWGTRHGRIADVLRNNGGIRKYGPHLIITVKPQIAAFVKEFGALPSKWQRLMESHSKRSSNDEYDGDTTPLSALAYTGSIERRSRLRRKYFSGANGLPLAAAHVVVVSYTDFLEDFLHFCQVPWETVVLDEGAAEWMAAAQQDTNSGIGQVWQALFSSSDHQTGLAGPLKDENHWNFTSNSFSETVLKDAWVGLTARHRMLLAPARSPPVHVAGLVAFVLPQFTEAVREEWDRSRMTTDTDSMAHLGKLVTRAIVVHAPQQADQDPLELASMCLQGKLGEQTRGAFYGSSSAVPEVFQDGTFVIQNKVAFARRAALLALGDPEKSWIRYELGLASIENILESMTVSLHFGHYCQEITTASSTTSSGATGQVTGTLAFRPAVCCGRTFGSEPGLRQHISGLHAPPGTWLCRTCGDDCITSQARTHHERSCGQPITGSGAGEQGSAGATPTVGQGASKVGNKKKAVRTPPLSSSPDDKDADGSMRVSGYQGVWANKLGKHFIKINGERYKENKKLVLYDSLEAAAKRYDDVLCLTQERNDPNVLLNYKEDGSRTVYEDSAYSAAGGLGGSSSNVVPALSVINIKDLPSDVKPLLRDPRQTSRTGGNSKRHVYAYRGVCRQARKGHDRWQSQISFMGVNHYLGTFDSEWDAAAIYAWAHLILYGEEATRAAQKEGEEAAAAFEQEKKDIASGKMPAPTTAKPEKKKKAPKKEKESRDSETPAKRKRAPKELTGEKKTKATAKSEKDGISVAQAKVVNKAPILAMRDMFSDKDDNDLIASASQHVASAVGIGYFMSEPQASYPALNPNLRPCVQDLSSTGLGCVGGALLYGISPSLFGWDLERFVQSNVTGESQVMTAVQMLAVEYDDDGTNSKFRTVMQGTVCTIGCASHQTQRMYKALGLGSIHLGGTVGALDCHVGGLAGSCSEIAACISYSPDDGASPFVLSCLEDGEAVSINGERVTTETGSQPLKSCDVVSVGARVFVFVQPER